MVPPLLSLEAEYAASGSRSSLLTGGAGLSIPRSNVLVMPREKEFHGPVCIWSSEVCSCANKKSTKADANPQEVKVMDKCLFRHAYFVAQRAQRTGFIDWECLARWLVGVWRGFGRDFGFQGSAVDRSL